MIIYKNDPKYKNLITSKNRHYCRLEMSKIRKNNKSTKSHFLRILINAIQSDVKSVYDRVYTGNLHQFQCHTM